MEANNEDDAGVKEEENTKTMENFYSCSKLFYVWNILAKEVSNNNGNWSGST